MAAWSKFGRVGFRTGHLGCKNPCARGPVGRYLLKLITPRAKPVILSSLKFRSNARKLSVPNFLGVETTHPLSKRIWIALRRAVEETFIMYSSVYNVFFVLELVPRTRVIFHEHGPTPRKRTALPPNPTRGGGNLVSVSVSGAKNAVWFRGPK